MQQPGALAGARQRRGVHPTGNFKRKPIPRQSAKLGHLWRLLGGNFIGRTKVTVVTSVGKIGRIVDDSLAYLILDETPDAHGKTLCFTPNVLDTYRGQAFAEYGISSGTIVSVDWDLDAEIVSRIAIGPEALAEARRSAFAFRNGAAPQDKPRQTSEQPQSPQIELDPDQDPNGKAIILNALPQQTREFGKIVDTALLLPGDLMLAREIKPDRTSETIVQTQKQGGYHDHDARWTHAAMYLGDGMSIIEATFDSLAEGGSVRVTNLYQYAQRAHALRFRRSKFISDDRQRWRLCIRAMTRLGKPYSFMEAVGIWFNIVVRGRGFFSEDMRRSANDAIICSLLYADAYGEAIRRSLGEREGICVPAWLSASDEFEDVGVAWLRIVR
jgi:hypothetical protein